MSKITNSKYPAKKTAGRQITNKSQIPIFNDQNFPGRDIVWIFEFRSRAAQALAPRVVICLIFDICYLEFTLFEIGAPLWGEIKA